jgi:hypothetical protein
MSTHQSLTPHRAHTHTHIHTYTQEQNIPYFLQLGDTYHAQHLRRCCLEALTAKYNRIDAALHRDANSAGGVKEHIESDELRAEVVAIVQEKGRKRRAQQADYEDLNDDVYRNTILPDLCQSRQVVAQATAVFGVMVGVATAWAFLSGL